MDAQHDTCVWDSIQVVLNSLRRQSTTSSLARSSTSVDSLGVRQLTGALVPGWTGGQLDATGSCMCTTAEDLNLSDRA
ncbi:hypothetical protein F2P81_019044 [Scophthalmus maximus]|uniref:Uncharacterized protein n=1 Tax=Scophthalmus maximus TaxID=52904 RepID=A0A6A4SBC4_SCOMX|nr:hypothetical protein F2P81_019044 [Scophthalmus maximus]